MGALTTKIRAGHPPLAAMLALVDAAVASRWGPVAAIATYLGAAVLIGINIPGLQFDEAIFEHGAVHMLRSSGPPPFTHNQGTWIQVGDRHLPLMVLPYIGSATFFVHALAFSLFGGSIVTARSVNLLLGAVGIWGVGRFGQSTLGPRLGTALGFALAIHPGYLTWTMYDNAGVAIWMAVLGIGCLALLRFIERLDRRSAFLLGVWLSLAVWSRANYVWLFIGVVIAVVCVLRRQILTTIRHWPVLIAGVAAGSLPLAVYQINSGFGTLQFIQTMSRDGSPVQLAPGRLAMAAGALVYDPLRRIIWRGPDVPAWQVVLMALLLVGAIGICLFGGRRGDDRERLYRIAALALIVTIGLTLTSRIRLGPHHFFVYVPLAAFIVLAAAQTVASHWRPARPLLLAIGLGYAAMTLSWDVRTAIGMRQTGGVAMWSDGVFAVAKAIETRYRGRTISILDWGLTNNLYVLTSGGFRPRELYWNSSAERTGQGSSWAEEVARGGIYVLNGPANGFKRAAGDAFRRAVEHSGLRFARTEFRQRDGQIYAELYEVTPGPRAAVGAPRPSADRRIAKLFPSTIVAGLAVNRQPDGSSAMAVRGTGFSRNDRIYWNDRELVTTFGTSEFLTALIPDMLLRSPAVVKISVRDVFHADVPVMTATLKIER
jgi:hypothetical protein